MGSPPPMRGKALQRCAVLGSLRITPAYAGKRGGWQPKIAGIQDHPRLCGEKRNSLVEFVLCPGSPPPMRGKGPSDAIVACVSGITPAYAGKSEASYTEMQEQAGSPPPMRGKGGEGTTSKNIRRITPAYAGKRFRC